MRSNWWEMHTNFVVNLTKVEQRLRHLNVFIMYLVPNKQLYWNTIIPMSTFVGHCTLDITFRFGERCSSTERLCNITPTFPVRIQLPKGWSRSIRTCRKVCVNNAIYINECICKIDGICFNEVYWTGSNSLLFTSFEWDRVLSTGGSIWIS
jgi:hypothetical protein